MGRQNIDSRDDLEFWRLVFDSYSKSGLSVSKFCADEGISPSSFYHWRKKLDPGDHSASTGDSCFLPLGELCSEAGDLNIAFPCGIRVNASNNCNVKLLCETVRILCEQRC